ncbi:hypothetical protein Cri9333_0589 [Crinalium epipsammum PCC 9333]|uniref:Uncharacterized protein n=1 Tax=Crinalium epipsammum PCC 9333 TaxID=1173022 RepID=K9VWM8_9CYAN|nr:hypothetical protein [Crinalium epipsammum]AFZ11535.1 hypothetical protein Cri9333_0589 [Crinalium epipsammum PCC 9333]
MSSISSRPRVQSVSLNTVAKNAVFTSQVITSAVNFLSSQAVKAYKQVAQSLQLSTVNTIEPVASLRAEYQLQQQQITTALSPYNLSATESIQLTALLTAAPYVVESNLKIQQPLQALQLSTEPSAARQAQNLLLQAVEASHHQVFLETLKVACTNAAVQIGFTSVQTMASLVGTVRLVATDAQGRSLVTEINGDINSQPSIATEVVGVSDGSCNAILDEFDRALEAAGVRAAVPTRKFTGGVCELAAAREFVRKKVKPQSTSRVTNTNSPNDKRRIQRLNQGNTTQQQ